MSKLCHVVTVLVLIAGLAHAQQPYPPQPQPQPYPPQPGYAPQPVYVQPVPVQPAMDPVRLARWEALRHKAHNQRVGGKVALGLGIPFFVIGMPIGIVAVYNNGQYLCSGISCDRNAAAAAGFTIGVLGLGGIAAGVALLVIGGQTYEQSERVRVGAEALKWIPAVSPLARQDGRFDGATLAWGFRL